MLPGRSLASRFAGGNEIEKLGENVRLKRAPGLCAAQHRGDVRRHQSVVARSRRAFGARTPETRHLENGAGTSRRKSVRRLEPERRTQNDGERLLTPRERAADGFDAGDLGRGAKLPQEEKREPARVPVRSGSATRGENGRLVRAGRNAEAEDSEEVGFVGRLCQTPAAKWRFTETPYNCRTRND